MSEIHSLKRFLSMLRRDAEAAPVANDALTYQGINQAQWLDMSTLFPTLDLWNQNGFLDRNASTIAFNDGLLRLTIAPVGVDYQYLQYGVLYTSTGDTFDIGNNWGLHVIYYNAGVLTEIVNPTHDQTVTIIEEYCIVAMVMWDVTGATGYLMDERHGMNMAPATHHWLHDNIGATWVEGLALETFTIGAGAANADAQFGTSAGEIEDEDMDHDLTAVVAATGLQIWYLVGANWRWTTNAGYSILLDAGTGRMAYNNAGAQAPVNNAAFALCHVFATNGTDLVPIAIQGQAQYATRALAQAGAETEIGTLTTGTLPMAELKPLGTVIFQTSNGYGNAVKSRVVLTGAGDNYVDWRTSPVSGGSPGTDHGSLAGLGDDDHLQYALLAGRAGGQILIGGTAAGEDLTLQSTSNATRGHIYFGLAGTFAYDEVNDRVGIGIAAPVYALDVQPTVTTETSAVYLRPIVNRDANNQRAIVFAPRVESNNTGLGAIGYTPLIYPGAVLGAVYGMIGVSQLLQATDDATSYNVTSMFVNYFRGDQNANYSGTVSGQYIFYCADAVLAGAGSITTQYGVYVASLVAATTNWAIYTAGTTPSRFGGQVGVGGVPAASAKVDIASTTGALLIPRMTTAQRNALGAVNGMIVYDSTIGAIYAREAGAWVNL